MTVTWLDLLGFSFAGAMIVMMALGIVLSAIIPTLDKWNKRYFITLFSLLLLCAVTCFLALVFWYDPTKAVAAKVVYVFEDISMSTVVFMPTILLLHSCGDSFERSSLFKIVLAFMGAYFTIVIAAQFTEVFYYVTPDNVFFRGSYWALMVAPLVAILLANVVAVIRRRKQLAKKYIIGLLVYMIPMALTLLLHMFLEIEVFVVTGMALFALIMYGLILSDSVDQYMRQQKRIANQQARIMVLQMRPHFICNSMMGIYSLCKQDPEKARQVTIDFTTYLRKNFANFASETPVPFTDELEHTRAYLAMEQAQYEDSLFVDFDTPYTHFRIPPLTLQPIVENAVVHGIRKSNDSIHVSIATRKTDTAIEIIVEDDGPGFKPTDDNEPHIALGNIRERLEMMCKGTLTIAARPEGGTSVKVTIPLDKEEE